MGILKKTMTVLLLSLSILLTFAGCQNEQDDIYSQAMNQASGDGSAAPTSDPESETSQELDTSDGDGLSGTLTIKSQVPLDNYSAVPYLAKEFMDLHPSVEIEIESGAFDVNASREELLMAAQSFYADVSMEIASGEADYLLYSVGGNGMNVPQLTRNGFLVDLWPRWEADSELDPERYFTNVLEGFKVDGKLTALPYSFEFFDLYLNGEILDELGIDRQSIKTVDPNQVLDWYEQARETHDDLNLLFSSGGKGVFYEYLERCRYIDLDSRTASFDSPEFIEFLDRSNNVLNEDPDLTPELIGQGGTGGFLDANISYRNTGTYEKDVLAWTPEISMAAIEKSRPGFAVLETAYLPNLITMLQPKEYAAGPYPLLSSDGKLGLISQEGFMMPASLKNQELAWEFMRYCLEARDVNRLNFMEQGSSKTYTTYIPLNKNTFQSMLEDINQNGYHGTNLGYSDFDTVDPQAMTERVDEILDREMANLSLYNVDMDEFLQEFFVNGLTTSQECAKKMQDRAYIWLNE